MIRFRKFWRYRNPGDTDAGLPPNVTLILVQRGIAEYVYETELSGSGDKPERKPRKRRGRKAAAPAG